MCEAVGKPITRSDLPSLFPYRQRDELLCSLSGANDVWVQLIYWQFCQTAAKWNNNRAAKYCGEAWRGGQGLPGGLPERRAGMPPRRGSPACSPPVEHELLLTRFSFRREKLSVARLQREVAQSKSEGAMVSCGGSLPCDSCLTDAGPRCVLSCWRWSPEH